MVKDHLNLFESIYDRGLIDAYLKVGRNYREGGWYHEALGCYESVKPEAPKIKKLKKSMN